MSEGTISGGDFLQVEHQGTEAVPKSRRHGRPRELGFLWAGAFVNYASLLTASLLTTYYGLGVWDGLAATVIGTVTGALILGLLSLSGPATGLPQIAYTARIFGPGGARVGAGLTLFLAVGWFAVDCVIAAQAGVQLLQSAGLSAGGAGHFLLPWTLAIAAVSVVVAIYGHGTIRVLEKYGAVLFAILAAVLFAILAPQVHWGQRATVGGSDHVGAFVLGLMTCFALVASWYPFASDYSRYLPSDSDRRATVLWPVVGVTLPMVLLGLFGLLIPTIDLTLAQQGPLAVIQAHTPVWFAVPFFAFVVLGEIWANYLDVYTAGLVALTLGIRRPRWQTALGCGVAGTALAAIATVLVDFHVAYEDFLILTYLWAPAWAGVVVLGARRLSPAPTRVAIVAWAIGTVSSLLFVNYSNLFANLAGSPLVFFNDGLVNALHHADISGLVSVAVAAGLYLTLARRRSSAPA